MKCESCQNNLDGVFSGFIVCPNCGHINITHGQPVQQSPTPTAIQSGVFVANSKQNSLSRFDLRSINRKFLIIAVFAFVFGLISITGITQNIQAQKRLNSAITQEKAGNYQSASSLLGSPRSFLVTPTIKHKFSSEKKANQRWLVYYGYQKQAESLVKDQKYSEALVLLEKIEKEYPTYATVSKKIDEIKKQQALVAQQALDAQKAADAAKKAAEDAKKVSSKTKSKPLTASNTPTAPSGCNPPSSISGKRYANTSAFSSVLGAQNVSQVQQIMQSFFSQYGMTVEVTSVNASSYAKQYSTYSVATSADICNLKAFSATLVDEWSKYPADWISNTRVKNIVIVKNLMVVSQHRAAMPDVAGSGVYYDLSFGSGDYMREVIHHEFAHLIEFNIKGSWNYSDPTWTSYNPAGFAYGSGGSSCYSNPGSCTTGEHPRNGFTTGYAMTAIEEDKAELYAYLMTNTYYHHLKGWLGGDPNLSSKVNYYKQFISAYSGTMTGSYFDQVNP